MTTTWANARRNEEDNVEQEVPLQSPPQALIDPLGENNTNTELRMDFQVLAQAMTAQANREMVVHVNPNVGTTTSRVRDLIRMNPREFYGSKVEENPSRLIDELYKVLAIIGVTLEKKAELAAYQLKDVTQVWYDQWKGERPIKVEPVEWEFFKSAFLDRLFPLELREAKVQDFTNLREESMSVKEYALKFTQLCKYAPTMVADSRSKMNKFVTGIFDMVAKECRTAILICDMDISHPMVHAQQMDEGKLKEKSREKKRSIMEDDNPSHARSDGHGIPSYRREFPGQGSSNTLKFNQERVSNPKPQGDSSGVLLPGCSKCDRRHAGDCLAGSNVCFGCGKLGHKIRHCPTVARNEGDSHHRSQPTLHPVQLVRVQIL
ncbi:uncharacterized protein LOC125833277 [Solanum verrucosum]|uniref:uncharacterized protein LOC125833277 n=1 Tax=Solanum verrucosum TaxID=315347 RepID=UPI0020D12A87|nr:uncharacterized protein LOC125833277 [Solanum verrucosum]